MRALGGREGGSSGRAFIFRVPRKKKGQKPQRNRGPWLLSPSFSATQTLRGECRFPLKEKKKNIKRRRLSSSPSFGLHSWLIPAQAKVEIALYLQGQIMRSLWLTFLSSFGAENTNYTSRSYAKLPFLV